MKSKLNLTVAEDVSRDARSLGLNMSRIAEAAIAEAVKAEKNRLWAQENRKALARYAEEITEEGPALARYRQF